MRTPKLKFKFVHLAIVAALIVFALFTGHDAVAIALVVPLRQ
jgi:hypothetical protein